MKKNFSLSELSNYTGCSFEGDPDTKFFGYDELKTATQNDVSFLSNMKYKDAMLKSKAGLVCISKDISERSKEQSYLICDSPSETFQKIINLFFERSLYSPGFDGIHESAAVHPSAIIEKGATVGPLVSIDQNATIGKNSIIHPNVSIGAGVKIGENCCIYSNVSIREGSVIGDRVIIQPGAVIGSCGYGYHTTEKKNHIKLDQLGIVILEDDVEVGANTTIDRARFKSTVIRQGTKIDNLVQIGHNVEIGKHNLIVSQTGIAGSTKTGDHVIMGGQCGIVGHIEIASHTVLTTRSGVSKSIEKPGIYGGSPIVPLSDHNKQQVYLRNIEQLNKKIKELECKINNLTNSNS